MVIRRPRQRGPLSEWFGVSEGETIFEDGTGSVVKVHGVAAGAAEQGQAKLVKSSPTAK